MPKQRPSLDLAALLPSWELHLRAERKSPATLKVYAGGARAFLAWAERTGTPAVLDRATVTAYVADLLDHGAEGNSAKARQLALRRFAAWLVEEGELDADPLLGLKPPRVDEKVTPVLSDAQLKALLGACQGPTFLHRRDDALVRLMLETGLRAGEAVALTVDDVDLRAGTALVRRGKGGKGRLVPFGPQTGRALDRYLRLRRAHRLAASPALWLGARSKTLGYSGLHAALGDRATLAGIKGFHPHVLRHTAAHRWLAAGGTEGGLMAVAGWSRRDMLDRYAAATAAERAADEARRLGLGDL
ncbi:MAG TPA: tyrosine-type recombinase/integrase [Actinomycetes bacterium]|jgi:site-specific recombinase XerD|nr:tyrosine-type recombinase/integrase [Actinomycetes bacterium]